MRFFHYNLALKFGECGPYLVSQWSDSLLCFFGLDLKMWAAFPLSTKWILNEIQAAICAKLVYLSRGQFSHQDIVNSGFSLSRAPSSLLLSGGRMIMKPKHFCANTVSRLPCANRLPKPYGLVRYRYPYEVDGLLSDEIDARASPRLRKLIRRRRRCKTWY